MIDENNNQQEEDNQRHKTQLFLWGNPLLKALTIYSINKKYEL